MLRQSDEPTKKLYMIGNAHLDPVWLWQWQDGFHEARATFRSALDRMNEYPDFVFVSSSAAYYEWIEQSDPQMFAEIRKRVAEGRWKIVGGWWIEPDCNLPSGESFVRQGLYGQRYFMEKFGVIARVGYNVDSFGHHAMLPQILKKSGLDYYVFMRPSPHEKGLPGRLFWWEADDGSRVMTFRIPFEYCSWGKDLDRQVLRCAAELRDPFNQSMCFYGVGNHGGGPTKENLESIKRLKGDPELPELVMASPQDFFESIDAETAAMPVVHDELQHHASGCYAVHSGVKLWNRKAENRLMVAEKLNVAANVIAGAPISQEFGQAWKNVLFNQFHDILAGTSVSDAYEDARDQYGEALSIADRATNTAIQAIAWNINIEAQDFVRPIIVFNPHAWEVKANVELEIAELKVNEGLFDDQDAAVPFQLVRSKATANGRARIAFTASLPAMGYRVYRLLPQSKAVEFPVVQASDTVLENRRFRLEFNPESGAICSLRDKVKELEVFTGEAAVPVVLEDTSDTWGHNVFNWNKVCGQFKATSVRLVERGPVKAVVRVTSQWGSSTLVQDFCMYAGRDEIDVKVKVDWRERQQMLKLRFPVNFLLMNPTYEIPYGHIVRQAYGDEEPGQSWIDLSGLSRDNGEMYGLSILNDGKYSFDVNVRDIGLTVLRSAIYAHHMPVTPEEDVDYEIIDYGVQEFHYTLLAHEGSWIDANTVRKAAELNQRPVALTGTIHPGPLPQSDAFIAVEPDNVLVSVVKKAEDNDDIILRCYETAGHSARGKIELPKLGRTIEAKFRPCEIKTFRIPRDPGKAVIETNLLEWTTE